MSETTSTLMSPALETTAEHLLSISVTERGQDLITDTNFQNPEGADITITETTLSALYITIGVIGVVGNLLVILVFIKMKFAKKGITNIFIINQSIIDFTTALFLILTTVIHRRNGYLEGVVDDLYCRLWLGKIPIWSCIMSSSYNLVFLTVERYLEVVHPIWHKVNYSTSKAGICIGIAWFIGPAFNIAYSIPSSKILHGNCILLSFWPSQTAQKVAGFAAVILQYFIPIICMGYCYGTMAYVIHKKTRSIQPAPSTTNANASNSQQQQDAGSKSREHKMTRAKKNILKAMAIVSLAFTLCYSCNQWFFLLFNLDVLNFNHFQGVFYHFSVVAMFFNCSVNPLIYTVKLEPFRKVLINWLCFWTRENQEGYTVTTASHM